MSKKEEIKDEVLKNEQETAQVEENQEVEVEVVKEAPSAEELLQTEKDKFLRLFAEFENYKKRTAKERIELFSKSRPIFNCDLNSKTFPISFPSPSE